MKNGNLLKKIGFTDKNLYNESIEPRCEYCQFGNRTKEGNKVLCLKLGIVDLGYSCKKFIYSPLKRIPVKKIAQAADDDDSI